MSLLPSAASPSLFSNINAAPTVLGLPFLVALLSLQVECRLTSKYVIMKGGERSLYGGDRSYSGGLMLEQSLSRKEAYRGRRRRKRRPTTNYISTYGGYPKRSRSRPRRPAPQVQEYLPEFDDLDEESGYIEERPTRSRPWSNHLYSASIRSREPSRPQRPEYYPRNRGKKPRPLPIGGHNYHSREPEELDNRWNEFRDDYPPRQSDWELDEPLWEPDRGRYPVRDEYARYNGDLSWRENRNGGRNYPYKNSRYNGDFRETLPTHNIPAYQPWSEDRGSQDDIEVQVKYPVWMEEPKGDKWNEPLFPGQRIMQNQQENGRIGNQIPGLNQDLSTHVLQPAKNKNKFRSGIGQNIRGKSKEINWELESPYQNPKVPDNNWEEPKPFENSEIIWSEQKNSKNYPWNPKQGNANLSNNEGQIEDTKNLYNRDYSWDESSSASNQEQWPESSTSPSKSYPYWDNSQQYYHDRSLRHQPVAQSKMDVSVKEDHDHLDSSEELKDLKA